VTYPVVPTGPAVTDWARVFRPRSVAVLGASGRPGSWMARPLRWLAERGFAGRVYPVNPKYDELSGLPCHPTLADVPGPVDLVLALVPARDAVDAVRAAGEAGAAAIVVFASGFAETGPEGAALQQRLAEAGRDTGVRVIGPNCQGVLYTPSRLFATFSGAGERPLVGSSGIGYVGQSGAVGGSVLDLAAERGLDLTAWVSTGNEADVELTEIGRHLVHDPEISVLTVYAESIRDGAAYERLVSEAAEAGTALVVLRSGRSVAGRRAAVSHTGAMLADDTAFTLVSRRHGVVLVDDVEELLSVATVLRGQPRPRGRRVVAVSTSGGAGTLAADRCEDNGLVLPELAEGTQEKLARIVPDFGSCANPVDVTAQLFQRDGRAFGDVCSIVCNDPATDALLVLVTMVTGEDAVNLAEDLTAAMAGTEVPCWVVWLAGRDHTERPRAILAEAGIPVFSSIALAARVAGMLAPSPRPDLPPEPRPAAPPALPLDRPGAGMPPGEAGWTLLDAIGVARPRSVVAHDPDRAATAARELGGPLALKAVAPGLAHKMDAGAVRLGVRVDDVASVYADLVERVPGLDGVLVQQMAPAGLELLVGATAGRDGWPPVLTVGLGGTATEVHRDLATAVAPVTFDEALAMLRSLRSWPLLAGHRGAPALDVSAAADVLVRVGRAIAHWPELVELEVNPLIVAGEGALAADVLITVDEDR
jgi:acyl-CoA synthetase (NDP forming)